MTIGASCALLLNLIFGTYPEEAEIRLAIDLTARELDIGETLDIKATPAGMELGLLRLLNDHPNLLAVSVGETIKVRRIRK